MAIQNHSMSIAGANIMKQIHSVQFHARNQNACMPGKKVHFLALGSAADEATLGRMAPNRLRDTKLDSNPQATLNEVWKRSQEANSSTTMNLVGSQSCCLVAVLHYLSVSEFNHPQI